MRPLIDRVKHMAVKTKYVNNMKDFLDNSIKDPMCQNIIKGMDNFNLKDLGITGFDAQTC